uniref:transposase n=1 Tax=Rickettsia endosymbiont of Urophora cardui TaxID=3066265 RepID=UPI00313C1424
MQIEKNKKINEAIDLLIEGGVDLKTVLSQNGLIKELTKGILERALHAEMSEHLGYSKYDRAETENARNGSFSKNLISENGTIESVRQNSTSLIDNMVLRQEVIQQSVRK